MARVVVFLGHYGSGKTTLAVRHALWCARQARALPVRLCDLDVVNPYYRAADFAPQLQAAQVQLIRSPWANTNVEGIWLPPEAAAALHPKAPGTTVVDLGGDPDGAVALGRYAASLRRNDVLVLLVVNFCRPLTQNPQEFVALRAELEHATSLPIGGLVHNSNLGEATPPDWLGRFQPQFNALCAHLGLPAWHLGV